MDLEELPELVLEKIVTYLTFADLVSLSQCGPSYLHFQPEVQKIKGKSFSVDGPNGGHFCPETYFDIPISTRGLKYVKMSFEWRDQGWGNQKGRIWLQLIREGNTFSDTHSDYFCVAPHKQEKRKVVVKDHPVTQEAVKGDVLRVMRNAGGGGGHSLHVKNFRMWINHKKYPEDDENINDAADDDDDDDDDAEDHSDEDYENGYYFGGESTEESSDDESV